MRRFSVIPLLVILSSAPAAADDHPLLSMARQVSTDAPGGVGASVEESRYTLSEVISRALANNPHLRASGKDAEAESFGIAAARAEQRPHLDLGGGVQRYRYATPVTPISGSPLKGSGFPEFDDTIYDFGVSFRLPLYRGGRLERGVAIAEMRKGIADDMYRFSRQELIYDLTSVYYKILQLEKVSEASDSTVRQLEAHRQNVELFLEAGTVPRVELLKSEAELAHARQNALTVRNNLEEAFNLLKTLMGFDDLAVKISLAGDGEGDGHAAYAQGVVEQALSLRPDYRAALRKTRMAEERVRLVEGRRLPEVSLVGDYGERSGGDVDFRENWNIGLRVNLPLFDGGLISADVNRARTEAERAREEERALRLAVAREVRDASLGIESAGKRIEATAAALDAARENLRVEALRYETGAGTSTDVIDAQNTLLRAEVDYQQAVFDRRIAVASLRRAGGEEWYGEVKK